LDGKEATTMEIPKMAIYNAEMDISVTAFKHRCLEIIRELEKTGAPVTITRHGKTVARLVAPSLVPVGGTQKPWERLQSMGGKLLADPEESVLRDEDFEALR
jgi:prevent-host-death family protein